MEINEKKIILKPESFKIVACENENLLPFLNVFCIEKEGFSQKQLGEMFGIIQTLNHSDQSAYLPNLITQVIKKEFFRNPKIGTEKSFESALHKANAALADLAEHEILNWLGNLQVVIGVVEKDNLFFARLGGGRIILKRNKKIADITGNNKKAKKNKKESRKAHPAKTFSNISSGKIKADDKLIFTTDDILDLMTWEDLERHAGTFTSQEFDNIFKSTLELEGENLGSIIVNLKEKGINIIKKKEEPEKNKNFFGATKKIERDKEKERSEDGSTPSNSTGDSMGKKDLKSAKKKKTKDKAKGKEKDKNEKNSSPFQEYPELFIREDKNEKSETKREEKNEKLGVVKKLSKKANSVFKKEETKILNTTIAHSQKGKNLPNEELDEEFSPALDLGSKKKVQKEHKKNQSFFADSSHDNHKKQEKSQHKKEVEQIPSPKFHKAEQETQQEIKFEKKEIKDRNSLKFLTKAFKSINFDKIKKSTFKINKKTKDYFRNFQSNFKRSRAWKKIDKLDKNKKIFFASTGIAVLILIILVLFLFSKNGSQEQVATTENSNGSQENINEFPHEEVGLKEITKVDAEVLSVTTDKNNFFFYTTDNKFFEFDHNSKKVEEVDLGGRIEGVLSITSMPDLRLIFLLSKDKLISYSPVANRFYDNRIKLPENLEIAGTGTHLTYYYILNKNSGKISRYPRAEGGFGNPKEWLKSPIEAENVVDMTIDDSIRIIKSDGKIEEYFQGKIKKTIESSTEPKLSPKKIRTKEGDEFPDYFVLDSKNGRIIKVSKEAGEIKETFWNRKFLNAKNFWLNGDDEEKTDIYVIDEESVIWKLEV